MMNKETINCGTLWYYNLSPERAITVRYLVQMKDEVDGDALKRAVEVTMSRYPYMRRKIVATPSGYHLENNDLPIVVLNTWHPIHLCGSEANWHQFAISWFDKTIYFNNTHSIFDGRGRSALLHTLMYYYCKFRYNEEIDMPGVQLADSPISPSEWADPFLSPIPEPAVTLPAIPKPEGAMDLSKMGLVNASRFQLHHLRIGEKELMARCKSNDATPNTAISLLMAKAIAKLHPDSTEPIVAGVYCDVRSALKVPDSHQCLVTTLDLEYTPDMRDLPFEEQNTIFRGRMLLGSDPSALIAGQKATQALVKQINALPTLEEKIAASRKAMDAVIASHTFSVSYSGKSSYGTCDQHIAALFPQPEAKGMGILIEITAADGWFFVTFIQEWKEDVYFNAFLKELISHGLDFDLLYSAQNEPARFSQK